MNIKQSLLIVSLVAGLGAMPTVFAAEGAKDIAAKCKAEATENEVPAKELRQYVSDCLSEHGIEAADAEAILNEIAPAQESADDKG